MRVAQDNALVSGMFPQVKDSTASWRCALASASLLHYWICLLIVLHKSPFCSPFPQSCWTTVCIETWTQSSGWTFAAYGVPSFWATEWRCIGWGMSLVLASTAASCLHSSQAEPSPGACTFLDWRSWTSNPMALSVCWCISRCQTISHVFMVLSPCCAVISCTSKAAWGQRMTADEEKRLIAEVRALSIGDLSQVMEGLPSDLLLVLRTE